MVELDRRSMLSGSAVTALAPEKTKRNLAQRGRDRRDRGRDGILPRLPSLDLESVQDLMRGLRVWVHGGLMEAAGLRAAAILKTAGVQQAAPVPLEELLHLFGSDPIIAAWARAWQAGQALTFQSLQQGFHREIDRFRAELRAAERAPPGVLELDAGLVLPPYCRHEFYGMPGGYCGDPLAGYIYHSYSLVQGFVASLNDGADGQDEVHKALAASFALPADGVVKRVLDIGTGIGQLATAMKTRFPRAEVHALDPAGPMLRYAQKRANDMGLAVHWRQALAEAAPFPDGSFDMVVSNALHHQVPAAISQRIFREVRRLLRSGGVYCLSDMYATAPGPTARAPVDNWIRFRVFVNHRWVYEPWMMQWQNLDLRAAASDAGLRAREATGFALIEAV